MNPDARVRIGFPWWLRPFLMKNVLAITLGRRIYVRVGIAESFMTRLLRHELAHVRQIERLGLFRFYVLYVAEFVRHLRRVHSVGKAYSLISFEIEATAAEEDL